MVLKAGVIVSGVTLLSRVLGLVRDSLIAVIFGAGHMTDAFFIALRVPNMFRRMVAEGSLATAAVPVLTRARDQSPDTFRKALGAITSLTLLCTVPIAAIGTLYARKCVLLLSPGLGTEEQLIETATMLLQILFPFVAIISVTAVLASALNATHRYAVAALPPAISNLVLIAVLGFLYFERHLPITWVAAAFLFGSIVALIPLLVQLWQSGLAPIFDREGSRESTRMLMPIFVPALFASSAHQLLSLLLSLLASMLPVGSISCLYYADRLYQFPLGIFSVALATAALPRLAELRGSPEQLNRELTNLLSWITIGVLPATVGLTVLASPIVRLIYEHGNFSPENAQLTARALQGYAVGLWPISLQIILVRAYLALGYGRIPAASTVVAAVVTPIAALALMGTPSSDAGNALAVAISTLQRKVGIAEMGQQGLALSSAIGMTAAVILLFGLLSRIHVKVNSRELLRNIAKTGIACAGLWIVLAALAGQITNLTTLVIVAVPTGIIIYGALILALGAVKASELKEFFRKSSPG